MSVADVLLNRGRGAVLPGMAAIRGRGMAARAAKKASAGLRTDDMIGKLSRVGTAAGQLRGMPRKPA